MLSFHGVAQLPDWVQPGNIVRVNNHKSLYNDHLGLVLFVDSVFRTGKVRVYVEEVGLAREFYFKELRKTRKYKPPPGGQVLPTRRAMQRVDLRKNVAKLARDLSTAT